MFLISRLLKLPGSAEDPDIPVAVLRHRTEAIFLKLQVEPPLTHIFFCRYIMLVLIETTCIVVIVAIDAAVVIIVSRHIPTSLPPLPTPANLPVTTATVVVTTTR